MTYIGRHVDRHTDILVSYDVCVSYMQTSSCLCAALVRMHICSHAVRVFAHAHHKPVTPWRARVCDARSRNGQRAATESRRGIQSAKDADPDEHQTRNPQARQARGHQVLPVFFLFPTPPFFYFSGAAAGRQRTSASAQIP